MSFNPVDESLYFSKNDPKDIRLGDIAKKPDKGSIHFSIQSYPDDEGIKLNGGRLGASLAPDLVRKYFYKMTPHWSWQSDFSITDHGNLNCKDLALENRHNQAQTFAVEKYKSGSFNITIGGGHDYGFPDAAAFLDSFSKGSIQPLVLNFDAHLDVRPDNLGLSSGTPFYKLLNKYSGFHFSEIGIQAQCNSIDHLNWCKNKENTSVLTYEQIFYSGKPQRVAVLDFLEPQIKPSRPTFISIDIDAFSSAYAMGCSQSWPTGFIPEEAIAIINSLIFQLDVKGIGIYEVSPPLDCDDRTSKLAAQLIYEFINAKLQKEGNTYA